MSLADDLTADLRPWTVTIVASAIDCEAAHRVLADVRLQMTLTVMARGDRKVLDEVCEGAILADDNALADAWRRDHATDDERAAIDALTDRQWRAVVERAADTFVLGHFRVTGQWPTAGMFDPVGVVVVAAGLMSLAAALQGDGR